LSTGVEDNGANEDDDERLEGMEDESIEMDPSEKLLEESSESLRNLIRSIPPPPLSLLEGVDVDGKTSSGLPTAK
jgi:hypothetical protein